MVNFEVGKINEADPFSFFQGKAEGDVLEVMVNALGDCLLGTEAVRDRLNGNPIGGSWAPVAAGQINAAIDQSANDNHWSQAA